MSSRKPKKHSSKSKSNFKGKIKIHYKYDLRVENGFKKFEVKCGSVLNVDIFLILRAISKKNLSGFLESTGVFSFPRTNVGKEEYEKATYRILESCMKHRKIWRGKEYLDVYTARDDTEVIAAVVNFLKLECVSSAIHSVNSLLLDNKTLDFCFSKIRLL